MSGCGKIGDLLGAYIYGDLTPDEMRRVRLHVDGCAICGRELESRTQAVALVPDGLPKMSDEEKQQVMWTVKGAIRAESERRGFRAILPALVKTGAVAVVVAGAFAAGAAYQFYHTPVKKVYVVERKEKTKAKPGEVERSAIFHEPSLGPIPTVDPGLLGTYEQSMRDLIDPPFRGHDGRPMYQPVPPEPAMPGIEAPKPWEWPDGVKHEDPSSSLWKFPEPFEPAKDPGAEEPPRTGSK